MSKHPVPWTTDCMGYIMDAEGREVAKFETQDPKTRAVLLHAMEMWKALTKIWNATISDLDTAIDLGGEIITKIEDEIAKGTT